MADSITMTSQGLNVPDNPIIPFIEGDGTGPDIWAAAVRVFDAAVEKAYSGSRQIHWQEVFAGEKAFNQSGELWTFFAMNPAGVIGCLSMPAAQSEWPHNRQDVVECTAIQAVSGRFEFGVPMRTVTKRFVLRLAATTQIGLLATPR